ncbi:MAG: hypothetical protein AAFR61_15170 [Bacteroidota bacterium]
MKQKIVIGLGVVILLVLAGAAIQSARKNKKKTEELFDMYKGLIDSLKKAQEESRSPTEEALQPEVISPTSIQAN